MHPTLLAVFFSAAISSATVAFVKISFEDPSFLRWLLLYSLFILYRTKIMIDDLGWYADLKRTSTDAHPVDVLFAVSTWVGWFAMAAVIGQDLGYYLVFFIITFVLSSIWIYAADYIANDLGDDDGSARFLNRVLFLRSKRHARWLLANLGLVAGGLLCHSSIVGWHLLSQMGIHFEIAPATFFGFGVGMLYVILVLDVASNIEAFKKSLIDAGKL